MNSNAKFTGFTPDELVEELKAKTEDPAEDQAWLEQSAITMGEILDEEEAQAAKSPESGQWMSPELIETAKQNTQITPPKKYKKKKGIASLLKDIAQTSEVYYDKIAVENLKAPSDWFPPGDFPTVEDLKKAKKQLQATSVKPKDGYYYSYGFPNTAATTTPTTVSMTAGTYPASQPQWFTYPMPGIEEAYVKEISWLKTQLAESKEVIKQLSGEPGEFIYIHPFDLYELLNSFVIPVVMNVEKEFSDCGYIEINGKKYKQSTLMPIKSKNSFVDATKYNDPGIKPAKYKPIDWAKTESVTIKEEMPMSEFEKKYPW